jgi:hypothetical protein
MPLARHDEVRQPAAAGDSARGRGKDATRLDEGEPGPEGRGDRQPIPGGAGPAGSCAAPAPPAGRGS